MSPEMLKSMQNLILIGLVAYLSDALLKLREQYVVDGTVVDEQVKSACVMFILAKDELLTLAMRTDNTLDDKVVEEVYEAACSVLSPNLVAELEMLNSHA